MSTKVNLDYSSVDFGDATANADVNLEVTATGNFADWDIEDDKTVTISGITLGGTNVDNYILAADGNQTSSVASIKPFLYVTADSIGYYVCSDRSYFSPSTAVPTGKTVVGMIAYVNDGITSGYIISKSDINPVKHANISFSSYTAITGLDAWATPSDEIWENMWSHVNGVAASTGMDALTDSYWSSNEENGGKGHYWTVGDSGNPKKAQTKNSTYNARAYTSFVIPSATIR